MRAWLGLGRVRRWRTRNRELHSGPSRSLVSSLRMTTSATRCERFTEDEIHAALTEVTGIGPWTADVFILFCLGRADGWVPGDLALQVAVQRALELAERPGKEEMLEIAERWRPWRAVAARLLWAYYAAVKQQRTAVPV